jgi:D-alanine-D-alanine ligase-like ATP-grasp enzyme
VTDAIAAPVPPLRAAVLAALAARGVPVRALGSSEPPVLLIGQGVKRRMFWRGFTDTTSHVGTVVATSKPLSKALLGGAGLPVPDGGVAADADAAVALSRRIGLPVVVKPAGADLGTGVSADIRHEQAVREAFALARPHGPVLVERHIPGSNHRILIVGGRFVAAVRHTPAQVVGDGVSRIVELVQRVNAGRADTLSPDNKKIVLDDAALWTLKWQGLSLESVPDAGAVVRLRTASNLSKGGTLEAVTDRVHPENRALAERAAARAAARRRRCGFRVDGYRAALVRQCMRDRRSQSDAGAADGRTAGAHRGIVRRRDAAARGRRSNSHGGPARSATGSRAHDRGHPERAALPGGRLRCARCAHRYPSAHKGDYGFNARTETYENLFKAGVIDPTKVSRVALENAASIAGMLLTTEAVIADKPKEEAAHSHGAPDMGGMGGY